MTLELRDIISAGVNIFCVFLGGAITVFLTSLNDKKKEKANKKIVDELMSTIWKDKINILYKPLLKIQNIIFQKRCSEMLFDILEYNPKLISPSLIDLIGEEKYIDLQERLSNVEDSFYDALRDGTGLNFYEEYLDKTKVDYKNIISKSIFELKELKKDIRSQSDNNFMELLMSLQKMINILETVFLSYANKFFIDKYINDCVNLYQEIMNKDGEVIDIIEMPPTDKDYRKLLDSKDKILEQVEQEIKQDTLFNKVKWEIEVRVKK